MACNCTPTLRNDLPALTTTTAATCCNQSDCDDACAADNALTSSGTEGTVLTSSLLDAKSDCEGVGVTLLGRIGSNLARLSGSGFIQIVSGKAFVVSSVALKVATLWHNWWKVAGTVRPILGAPLPYPNMVIADATGNLHAIRGEDDVSAVPMWDGAAKTFSQVPVVDLPKDVKGLLPISTGLELVGYEPIPEGSPVTSQRPLCSLYGAGIAIGRNQVAPADPAPCAGCVDGVGIATVIELLPTPETGTYVLTSVDGVISWVEQA